MGQAIILGVMNNKGGVGKSSLSISLGLSGSRSGLRSLLVDMDSQANLTQRLGLLNNGVSIDGDIVNVTRLPKYFRSLDSLDGEEPDLVLNVKFKGNRRLKGIQVPPEVVGIIAGDRVSEIEANSADERLKVNSYLPYERRDLLGQFRKKMESYKQHFDIIVLDTAPALEGNKLNRMAATAVDYIIVPIDDVEAAMSIIGLITWLRAETAPEKTGGKPRPQLHKDQMQQALPRERPAGTHRLFGHQRGRPYRHIHALKGQDARDHHHQRVRGGHPGLPERG